MNPEPIKPAKPIKKPVKNPLAKRMRIMLIIVLLTFGLIFAFDIVKSILMKHFFAHFAMPAVTISSTKATASSWTPTIDAVGSITAINGVEISSEVSGMVVGIYFKSGEMVKAGQPLVQLDDQTDQQDLKNLSAQLELANANYQRQLTLMTSKSTSQLNLDDARSQLQQMQAQVNKTQILISKKLIKAPFAGKIGIRQVNLGQYLSPGTPLVNLQSLNPVYVNFSLPEQYLESLSVNQPVVVQVDSFPGRDFKGNITAIDAAVDVQTRNILVQALLPNDDLKLYPGLFANVDVLQPTRKSVITVPQTSISFSLYGDSVFVLTSDGKDKDGKALYKAHRVYVTTGDRRGNEIAVTSGLKAGDMVVTSGQLKLEDGVQAYVDNSVQLPGLSPEQLEQKRN